MQQLGAQHPSTQSAARKLSAFLTRAGRRESAARVVTDGPNRFVKAKFDQAAADRQQHERGAHKASKKFDDLDPLAKRKALSRRKDALGEKTLKTRQKKEQKSHSIVASQRARLNFNYKAEAKQQERNATIAEFAKRNKNWMNELSNEGKM